MAKATNTTNLDRAAIMRGAWSDYRFQMRWSEDKRFDRALFARLLTEQWHFARLARAEAIERAAEEARLSTASAIEQRIAAIKADLGEMDYAEFIPWDRHGDLTAELARLAA